jgi:hypothetical protein
MNNYSQCRAFANGALDAYNTGTDSNPYDPETNPTERQAYEKGYDYGIFLYCQDNEGI